MKPMIQLKYSLIFSTFIYLICTGGCATNRLVEISVPRASQSQQFYSHDLTPTAAEQLFRQVAAQFGLEVRGQILEQGNNGTITNYTALPGKKSPLGYAYLDLFISKNGSVFHCISDDFTKAEEMALEFKRPLDKEGVQYTVTKTTASALNN